MLNEPLYQLGDSFTLTGLDLIEENGNLTYIYSEDPGFISEQYIYDPFSADSDYSENYSYSSSDGETLITSIAPTEILHLIPQED